MFTDNLKRILIILFSLFSLGFSIKCFQCNSAESPQCADLTVNDTGSKFFSKCTVKNQTENLFCRKVETSVLYEEDSTRIIRSCGFILSKDRPRVDTCRKDDTDFIKRKSCYCFSDACNSTHRVQPKNSLYIFLFSLGIVSMLYKKYSNTV